MLNMNALVTLLQRKAQWNCIHVFSVHYSSYQLHWSQYSSMKGLQFFHYIHSDMSADLPPTGESEHQLLLVYMYHLHLYFFSK